MALIILTVIAVALLGVIALVAGSMVLVGLLEHRHRELERDVSSP